MTDPTELRALASAWCDDRLDEAGARRLDDLLRDDPETQERFLEYMDLHAVLCRRLEPLARVGLGGETAPDLLAAAAGDRPLPDATEFDPIEPIAADRAMPLPLAGGLPRKRLLAAIAALAAVILVGVGLFLTAPSEVATTEIAGEVELTRAGVTRPAAPPEGLRTGDRLRTGEAAYALVRTADGGRLRLDGNSLLEMTSDRSAATRWKLELGTLQAVAGGRPLRFEAAEAVARLTPDGEAFVFVGPDHARVEATAGTLEPDLPDGDGKPARAAGNGIPIPDRAAGNGIPVPGGAAGNGIPRLAPGEAAERPPGGAWRRVEPRVPPRVTAFLLVDAVTGNELQPLPDGAVIDLGRTGSRIQLQALVAGDVAAVRLNGAGGKRIEHEGQEVPWSPTPGPHVVTALPLDPEGRPGTPSMVSFRIVAEPSPP